MNILMSLFRIKELGLRFSRFYVRGRTKTPEDRHYKAEVLTLDVWYTY